MSQLAGASIGLEGDMDVAGTLGPVLRISENGVGGHYFGMTSSRVLSGT